MAIERDGKSERVATNPGSGPVSVVATSKGGATGAEPAVKKKSKKKLIIIAVVLLLVAGAGAKFTILAPASKASAAESKPKPGPVLPMEDMTLNLADGHFLRLKMAIQTIVGTSDELDTSEASQLIIDEFSNKTVASLTGKVARAKVQDALVVKIKKAYPKQIITAYYTEFVMQ